MELFPIRRRTRWALVASAAIAVAGCDTTGFDFDLRDDIGGPFSTSSAVGATAPKPVPDSRGVISYPAYDVVIARGGDTPAIIGSRLGVSGDELASFNGLNPDSDLRQGEILALPTRVTGGPSSDNVDITALATGAIERSELDDPSGTAVVPPEAEDPTGQQPIRHQVERGETAFSIARLYGVSVTALADWNNLGPDLIVREDQFLLIPITVQPEPTPGVVTASPPGVGSATPVPPSASQPLPEAAPVAETPDSPGLDQFQTAASDTGAFAYPATGRIIRGYRKGTNDGIDIAAPAGTPVQAAQDGEVAAITRDTDQVPILVLRHPNNLLTVYANVTDIRVEKGAQVRRGQQIAAIADGDPSFVHFEIREGVESVDPIPFLQ